MRPVNEKLRADLLEAGKREFMENGFRGASLKSIAASLGVTTGAIYRYYTDKEALFDGLVREPAHELVERYRTLQQTFAGRNLEEQLQKLPEVPDKEASWMMDFLYDHFDAFKLIACCSSGTKYEHYLDTLAEIEDHSGRLLVDRMVDAGYPIRRLDDELIHIMSTALFNGMFETPPSRGSGRWTPWSHRPPGRLGPGPGWHPVPHLRSGRRSCQDGPRSLIQR